MLDAFDIHDKPVKAEATNQNWLVANVINPIINGACIDPLNVAAGMTTPELKRERLQVAEAQFGSAEWLTQNVCGGIASLVPYVTMGKVTGGVMRSAGRLAGAEGTLANVLASERVAQVAGAGLYDGLRDPGQGETRLGNAFGGVVGFGAFEIGNAGLKASMPLAEKLIRQATVGLVGGAGQYAASHVVSGQEMSREELFKGAVTGGAMNILLPGLQHVAGRALDFAHTKTDGGIQIRHAINDGAFDASPTLKSLAEAQNPLMTIQKTSLVGSYINHRRMRVVWNERGGLAELGEEFEHALQQRNPLAREQMQAAADLLATDKRRAEQTYVSERLRQEEEARQMRNKVAVETGNPEQMRQIGQRTIARDYPVAGNYDGYTYADWFRAEFHEHFAPQKGRWEPVVDFAARAEKRPLYDRVYADKYSAIDLDYLFNDIYPRQPSARTVSTEGGLQRIRTYETGNTQMRSIIPFNEMGPILDPAAHQPKRFTNFEEYGKASSDRKLTELATGDPIARDLRLEIAEAAKLAEERSAHLRELQSKLQQENEAMRYTDLPWKTEELWQSAQKLTAIEARAENLQSMRMDYARMGAQLKRLRETSAAEQVDIATESGDTAAAKKSKPALTEAERTAQIAELERRQQQLKEQIDSEFKLVGSKQDSESPIRRAAMEVSDGKHWLKFDVADWMERQGAIPNERFEFDFNYRERVQATGLAKLEELLALHRGIDGEQKAVQGLSVRFSEAVHLYQRRLRELSGQGAVQSHSTATGQEVAPVPNAPIKYSVDELLDRALLNAGGGVTVTKTLKLGQSAKESLPGDVTVVTPVRSNHPNSGERIGERGLRLDSSSGKFNPNASLVFFTDGKLLTTDGASRLWLMPASRVHELTPNMVPSAVDGYAIISPKLDAKGEPMRDERRSTPGRPVFLRQVVIADGNVPNDVRPGVSFGLVMAKYGPAKPSK